MSMNRFGVGRCCCAPEDFVAFVYGGNSATAQIDSTEGYIATSDAWSFVQDMLSVRSSHAGANVGGLLYSAAGAGLIRTTDEYDPGSDVWTNRADTPLPGRAVPGGAEAGGVLYIFGGTDGFNAGDSLVDTDAYTPATNSWASEADMPTPGRHQMAAFSISGVVYAAGGETLNDSPISRNETVAFSAGAWAARANLPRGRGITAGTAINGKGYIAGGTETGTESFINDTDEYDPAGDAWTSKTDMPDSIRDHVAFTYDGLGYFCGGTGGGNPVGSVFRYDPVGNSWDTLNLLAESRRTFAGAAA